MSYFNTALVATISGILAANTSADGEGCSVERLSDVAKERGIPGDIAVLVARHACSEDYTATKGVGFHRVGTKARRAGTSDGTPREVSDEYVDSLRQTIEKALALKGEGGGRKNSVALPFIAGMLGDTDMGKVAAGLAKLPQFDSAKGRGVFLREQAPAAAE